MRPYWTIDLKLEQTFAEHWKVTLQAMNLLDQDYDTYVGTFYPTYTLCALPRSGPQPVRSRSLLYLVRKKKAGTRL